jgi:hypothetical protein
MYLNLVGYIKIPFRVGEKIGYNIRDKESSFDLETGAEFHRFELEE